MNQIMIDVTVPGVREPLATLAYPTHFSGIECVTTVQTAVAYVTGVMASVKASVHSGLRVEVRNG